MTCGAPTRLSAVTALPSISSTLNLGASSPINGSADVASMIRGSPGVGTILGCVRCATAEEAEPARAVMIIVVPITRRMLAGSAVHDAGIDEPGRVRVVKTPFAGRGVYPPRYFTEEPSPDQVGACVISDLAVMLRPASELAEIDFLEAQASELGSGVLRTLVDQRRSTVAAACARYAPDDADPGEWLHRSATVAKGAEAVVLQYAEIAHGKYETRSGELTGLAAIASSISCGVPSSPLLSIDQTEGVPLTSLAGLAHESILLNEREAEYWSPLLADARRVRGAIAGGISASDRSDMLSFVDRVDAIVALIRVCHLPRLAALVDSGAATLGHVIRDPNFLHGLLAQVPRSDAFARHALGTALAMLGELPSVEALWPDAADVEDARAYCASIALAVEDGDERTRLMDYADRRALGGARAVTEAALMRTEAGHRLVVVE